MKTKYIISSLIGVALLTSCSKEAAFEPETSIGMGSFSTEAIELDVRAGNDTPMEVSEATRAGDLDDFKVIFTKKNAVAPEATYRYSEMPDVVVLPVGTYTVTATKGTNVEAEWESPYIVGNSAEFDIKENEVTSDLDPVVCKLENVQVSVNFAPVLSGNMSSDSYVEVKVGDNAGLQFSKEHEGTSGHFRHTEGVSLVATFHGEVEGIPTVETKSFEQVQKGHHYMITFKLHTNQNSHYGEADASVNVEASVTTVDLENNVVIGEDEDLGDEERPREDDGPVTPPVTGNEPPSIVAQDPIDLEKTNDIVDGMECVLNVTSTAEGGFTKFECDIKSPKLTPEELAGVGLSSHLDLINPENLREPLTNLGLLKGEVKGAKQVKFDLTGFLPLISVLGAAEHKFILTVGDANGKTTKTLILKQN